MSDQHVLSPSAISFVPHVTSVVFDITTENGTLDLLRSVHRSMLEPGVKNELRDAIFEYKQTETAEALQRVAELFGEFGIEIEHPAEDGNLFDTATKAIAQKSAHFGLGSPRPKPSFGLASAHRTSHEVVPNNVELTPLPPVTGVESVPTSADDVSKLETSAVPDILPALDTSAPPVDTSNSDVQPQNNTIETTADDVSDSLERMPVAQPEPAGNELVGLPPNTPVLDRINQIKKDINQRVGNPVHLIDTDNNVGREYMSALLDAMKKSNGALPEELQAAMVRLETAYTAALNVLANKEQETAVEQTTLEQPHEAPAQTSDTPTEQASVFSEEQTVPVVSSVPVPDELPPPPEVSTLHIDESPLENTIIPEQVPSAPLPSPIIPSSPQQTEGTVSQSVDHSPIPKLTPVRVAGSEASTTLPTVPLVKIETTSPPSEAPKTMSEMFDDTKSLVHSMIPNIKKLSSVFMSKDKDRKESVVDKSDISVQLTEATATQSQPSVPSVTRTPQNEVVQKNRTLPIKNIPIPSVVKDMSKTSLPATEVSTPVPPTVKTDISATPNPSQHAIPPIKKVVLTKQNGSEFLAKPDTAAPVPSVAKTKQVEELLHTQMLERIEKEEIQKQLAEDKMDPLMTPDVGAALQQLISEWDLFKNSGFFGTGPSGKDHELYKRIASLPMQTVVAGRFEGATPEVRQSLSDYMNGWRYEEGIVHEFGETFEHYLRRVIRHILDRRKNPKEQKI